MVFLMLFMNCLVFLSSIIAIGEKIARNKLLSAFFSLIYIRRDIEVMFLVSFEIMYKNQRIARII